MRINTSSLASRALSAGSVRWGLTTRDSVRQEAPGALTAGAGGKGPAEMLGLRTGKADESRPT
jgi:hypothetical protein